MPSSSSFQGQAVVPCSGSARRPADDGQQLIAITDPEDTTHGSNTLDEEAHSTMDELTADADKCFANAESLGLFAFSWCDGSETAPEGGVRAGIEDFLHAATIFRSQVKSRRVLAPVVVLGVCHAASGVAVAFQILQAQ